MRVFAEHGLGIVFFLRKVIYYLKMDSATTVWLERRRRSIHKADVSRGQWSTKRIWVTSLCVCLGACLLVFAANKIYRVVYSPASVFEPVVSTPRPVPPAAPTQPTMGEGATPPPSPTLSPEEELKAASDMEFMKNRVNILLLGWDQSPEREEEGSSLYRDENNNFRSDVLLLLAVDFAQKRVDMISVPRDTYAPIYKTKGRWKINAAFAQGGSVEGEGFTYAMHTVSDLLGVPIQYYAGVDMLGLKAVVDAMGGLEYDVDVRIVLNGRVLETGYQQLDGQQVLDYCRARKGISTDVGRADRQQRILFAVFEQLKSRNQLVKLPQIYLSTREHVHTNLNMEQIAALSLYALDVETENIHRHTLDGKYMEDAKGSMFYVLYNSKLKALIREVYGLDIRTNPQYDVSYVQQQKEEAEAAALAAMAGDGEQSVPGMPSDLLW